MRERTQQELNLAKGPLSESVFDLAVTNMNEAQNMVEGYGQQAQRNLDVWQQGRIGENLINQESTEKGQVQQDAVNFNSNFGMRQEKLEGNATNNTKKPDRVKADRHQFMEVTRMLQ